MPQRNGSNIFESKMTFAFKLDLSSFLKLKIVFSNQYLSRLVGKQTICIGENKDAVTAKLISAFVFATRIVQFLF